MHRSPSDPRDINREQFARAMAPLFRLCRDDKTESAESRADTVALYFAAMKHVPEQYLRAAVIEFVQTATEPWLPMPGVLLLMARKAKRADVERQVAAAPDCVTCENTGLVSARPHGSHGYAGFACTSCVRGRQFKAHARFNPQTMDSFKDQARRLAAESPPPARLDVSELTQGIGNVPVTTEANGG